MHVQSKLTAEGLLWWLVVLMGGAFVATLVAHALDSRTIDGVQNVWSKPLKFELSLALHAATLALAISLLSPEARADRLIMLAAIACCAATVFELGYIAIQAARQEASHFNVGTPVTRLLYAMMAFGAVVLVGAAAVVGVVMLFDSGSRIPPALRLGIAWFRRRRYPLSDHGLHDRRAAQPLCRRAARLQPPPDHRMVARRRRLAHFAFSGDAHDAGRAARGADPRPRRVAGFRHFRHVPVRRDLVGLDHLRVPNRAERRGL